MCFDFLYNFWPTGRICMKLDIWVVFESVEIINIWLKSDKNNGYFKLGPMYIYGNISLSSS
jgi:hypothetical protein